MCKKIKKKRKLTEEEILEEEAEYDRIYNQYFKNTRADKERAPLII